MKTLALRGVSVRFGAVQALDDVDLDLKQGQVTLLAGPNGSGKSTLRGVLLGLVRPDAGELRVDDRRVAVDRNFKACLGYLPEAVAFAGNLTARQVLGFFARARGVDREQIRAVLERVQLVEAARRSVRGFSRGMIQRLGLAVAILSEPELLILDEPTGGLDQQGLGVLWGIIEQWREAGRFVIVASHDLTLLERRVGAVVLLSQGRSCARGEPLELRRRAKLPVAVHFEMASEDEAIRLAQLLEGLHPQGLERSGGKLTIWASAEKMLEILALYQQSAAALVAPRIEEPGFDAVYQSLLEGSCSR